MRKSMFASFAALVLGASLALTGCKVGDDGGGDTGGDDNPGTDEGDDEGNGPDAAVAQPCPPSVEEFTTDVFEVAIADKGCTNTGCHGSGAGAFTLTADDQDANLVAATAKAKKLGAGGKSVLLIKPTGGGSHAGGAPITDGSTEYLALEKFVNQVNGTGGVCD